MNATTVGRARAAGEDCAAGELIARAAAMDPALRLPERAMAQDPHHLVLGRIRSCAEPLQKYLELASLQDRDEALFCLLMRQHLEELLPYVYTPTVGAVVERFSELAPRARGVWIAAEHRGRMADVLRSAAPRATVKLIVATDNESILGIGDQGAGGMAIAIGKLAIYSAAGGIHPASTLPVSLDVGTDNEHLLNSASYIGRRHRRIRGQQYLELLDEFVRAVSEVFPAALVQWEDFRKETAITVLDRFRRALPSFNDDIQGTGAVACAGVRSGCSQLSVPLGEQRIVVHGAGAAGFGIVQQLRRALCEEGLSDRDARNRVLALDSRGLLVRGSGRQEAYKEELGADADAASAHDLHPGSSLLDVAARFRPGVLIGTSGQRGAFSRAVIEAVVRGCPRPIVLPMSNPSSCCEGTPEEIIGWSGGAALVATGSPFPPVSHNGRLSAVAQANNAFVFPGLGLGALAVRASCITDGMIRAASRALAAAVSADERRANMLFPAIRRLPEVTLEVATAVGRAALEEGLTPFQPNAVAGDMIAREAWLPHNP